MGRRGGLLMAYITHGMSHHPLYKKWIHINERCERENHHNYKRYGARGISMWEGWRNSFPDFAQYLSELEHYGEKGYTLDRINNDRGYEPGNVRWATAKEQQRNTRQNTMLAHNGETLCLAEWQERTGINYQTISERLKRGWSAEKALTTPVFKTTKKDLDP